MTITVICRNPNEDRVIPRFARYLSELRGWEVSTKVPANPQAVYLSGYFDHDLLPKRFNKPLGAYLTHREEVPPNGYKAKNFDKIAGLVDLRVTTAQKYYNMVAHNGLSKNISAPIDHDIFNVPTSQPSDFVIGFSGFQYKNGRKNYNGHAQKLVKDFSNYKFMASGMGWPCPTSFYKWQDLGDFYKSLSIWVMVAGVEGVPMPLLESLACGVSVVVPNGVGIVDELPEMPGIYKYDKNNYSDLCNKLSDAIWDRGNVDRFALSVQTEGNTIENWQLRHKLAFEELLDRKAKMDYRPPQEFKKSEHPARPEKSRGIFIVAYGEEARNCAKTLIASCKKHTPEIPICLAASEPLSEEDFLVKLSDADIGARTAKLSAYDIVPPNWESVLYLDADTVVKSGDIRYFFEVIEAGFQFAITKDPEKIDTLLHFRRPDNGAELEYTKNELGTLDITQFNGGVWSFGRGDAIKLFFDQWLAEWTIFGMRDQAALVRAMHKNPLATIILSNHFNRFDNHQMGITENVVLEHFPATARRFSGFSGSRYEDF